VTNPWFRVGLRVADVAAAARFYGGLGFQGDGSVPSEAGHPLLVILRRGSAW
jgi:PhnB protein